jgi:anti-anti-sigma regulatory factor
MKVKIDTKEKFHVITPLETNISANLTENLNDLMHGILEKEVKNVVFNVAHVQTIDEVVADAIAAFHKEFYAQNASFVICTLTPQVENLLGSKGYLDILNITPTESEAWDIVQMEEIEREIFGEEMEE